MADLKVIQNNYDSYYASGINCLNNDNLIGAIENLKKAVGCMIVLADNSPSQVQQAKRLKASELLTIIEDLQKKQEEKKKDTCKITPPPQAIAPTKKEKPIKEKKEEDEDTDYESEFEVAESTGISFDDVIGNDAVKQFVKDNWIDRYDPNYKKAYEGKYAPRLARGLLLYGLPGTGKTMLAQAIATEFDAAFFNIDASKIVDKYVGETEKTIARLFKEASQRERAIIFIDEIDSILALPSEEKQGHQKSSLNQWLQMMDGFEKGKVENVIVIGCTNFPNAIAPSALRVGRLGKQFRVDLPIKELRRKMIDDKLPSDCYGEGFSPEYLAIATCRYTLSDLSGVCDQINLLRSNIIKKAIDEGKNVGTIKFNKKEIDALLRETHSSVTNDSILDIAKFEKRYNICNSNGSIIDFIEKLTVECK